MCENDNKLAAIDALLMAIAIGVIVLLIVAGKHDTIYQVTVSDDVSMNEFYEKYDVQEVKGKLYKVTEKENKK